MASKIIFLMFIFSIFIVNVNCHIGASNENEKQSLINDLQSNKSWIFENLKIIAQGIDNQFYIKDQQLYQSNQWPQYFTLTLSGKVATDYHASSNSYLLAQLQGDNANTISASQCWPASNGWNKNGAEFYVTFSAIVYQPTYNLKLTLQLTDQYGTPLSSPDDLGFQYVDLTVPAQIFQACTSQNEQKGNYYCYDPEDIKFSQVFGLAKGNNCIQFQVSWNPPFKKFYGKSYLTWDSFQPC